MIDPHYSPELVAQWRSIYAEMAAGRRSMEVRKLAGELFYMLERSQHPPSVL